MIGLLNHLNGPLATVLLCTLLYVDEVGVPLPFAPNEVLLLAGGLLLASGVLVPWLFIPLAFVAMLAGMLTAFLWARALGRDRLGELAERIDARKSYDKAVRRITSTNRGGIAVARLLPGVRVYVTLAAGASGLALRRFLVGAIPALVVWLLVLVLVGDLVGRPAEALISRVDQVILTGALLILLGAGAFLVVRHVPRPQPDDDDRFSSVPRGVRHLLAAAVDVGIVGSAVTGVALLGGHFVAALAQLNAVVGISVLLVVVYVVAARRGTGATLGEGLFGVDLRLAVGRRRSGSSAADPDARPRCSGAPERADTTT